MRVVIDTNIWIRILLRGRVTLPILEAFNQERFELVMSQFLLDELHEVWQRPRLLKRINPAQAIRLETQLKGRALDALTRQILPAPFERGAAKAYALVRAAVPERRRDALDKLIASHAKSLNLTLVTNNLSDFQVYSDIQLENWCGSKNYCHL